MASDQTTPRDAFAPGWAAGFGRSELLRRAEVYRQMARVPGMPIVDRNACERMVQRYEDAANGKQ